MIDAGKLPHAIILEGGNADNRVKLARLLAAALVCKAAHDRPCKACAACVKSFGAKLEDKKFAGEKLLSQPLHHADISEIQKEKDRKQFSVKVIRILRKEAYIVPNEADAKVYILLEAQLMNEQAQNAFLKVLEEPPGYICFIMECTSKNILLPTVLSRAACFSLGQLDLTDGIRAKKTKLAAQTAAEMAVALTAPHDYELLKKTAVFEKDKSLPALCLPELELMVRDALILQISGGECFSASPQAAQVLAEKLSREKLLQLIDEIRLLIEATQRSANNNLLITRICSRLRGALI